MYEQNNSDDVKRNFIFSTLGLKGLKKMSLQLSLLGLCLCSMLMSLIIENQPFVDLVYQYGIYVFLFAVTQLSTVSSKIVSNTSYVMYISLLLLNCCC